MGLPTKSAAGTEMTRVPLLNVFPGAAVFTQMMSGDLLEIRRIHAILSCGTAARVLHEPGLIWKTKAKNFPSGCRAEPLGSSPDGCTWTFRASPRSAINHQPGKPPDASSSQSIPAVLPSIKAMPGIASSHYQGEAGKRPNYRHGGRWNGSVPLCKLVWASLGRNAPGGSRITSGAQWLSIDFCCTDFGLDAGQHDLPWLSTSVERPG